MVGKNNIKRGRLFYVRDIEHTPSLGDITIQIILLCFNIVHVLGAGGRGAETTVLL